MYESDKCVPLHPKFSMNMQESKSIIEVNGVSKFFGEKTALIM